MKICPKCRYLDHEENGPNYECPKCGVIYSRALDAINEEKRRKNEINYEKSARSAKAKTSTYHQPWTWEGIKSGSKSRQTFWVWAGIISIILTSISLRDRALKNDSFIPLITSTAPPQDFLTKYEMRTQEPGSCPIKILSNGAPNTIFILLDSTTRDKKALFFLRSGDEIETQVPPGNYAYQMIQGNVWLGEDELFGPTTAYLDGDKTFDFRSGTTGTQGNTITLRTVNGNMHPTRTGKINLK